MISSIEECEASQPRPRFSFSFAGNQNGRVAWAPRPEFAWNFAAGDVLGGVDHFENGKAAAVSDVEGFAGNAIDFFESANVGICNVENVDVISDASSIRGGIVRAKNIDLRKKAAGSVEYAWDEVSFHAMIFAKFLGGTCGIEIPQGHVVKLGVGFVVRENLLEHQLGLSVRIDGRLAMVLGNGNDLGLAIGGRSGRENKFLDTVTGDSIQQIHAASHVRGIENTWLTDGLGDQGFGGEMHHGINFVPGKDAFQLLAIPEIYLTKDRARRDGGAVALDEIVEGNDAHSAGQQEFRTDAADVACRSSDQNIHGFILLD